MKPTRSALLAIMCLLVYGVAAAATRGLISSHVPVMAGATTEIAIRELEFLTWWAMPESRIQAVLWPYKVNSPHEKSDGANINPASMANLRISAVLYPAASCLITIDVSDMTELPTAFTRAHGHHGRAELIVAVIEATSGL